MVPGRIGKEKERRGGGGSKKCIYLERKRSRGKNKNAATAEETERRDRGEKWFWCVGMTRFRGSNEGEKGCTHQNNGEGLVV